MKKYIALLLVLILALSLAACGKADENNETFVSTAVAEDETSKAETTVADTTAKADETETETSAEKTESKIPETPMEIIEAYTTVMNKAKDEKVGFKKAEWQSLPSDANSRVVSKGGTLVNIALNAANNFMTDEATAKKNPDVYEKGGDMKDFPIRNTPYGCTLTEKDLDKIETIKCEELKNGNYKITIVLKSEKNPEPAPEGTGNSPSFTGRLITPISKKQIDENLNGGIVSAVAKDIVYSLTFHDVTSVVEYNPETNQIVKLEQTTRVTVSGSGKIGLAEMVVDKQELVNDKYIYDLVY